MKKPRAAALGRSFSVATVRSVVSNVKDLLNGNNVQAFTNALNRNNVQILNLTNTLNNNEIIKNVLNNANIAIGRVVSIDVLSGGGVNLFVAPTVATP